MQDCVGFKTCILVILLVLFVPSNDAKGVLTIDSVLLDGEDILNVLYVLDPVVDSLSVLAPS